MHDTYTWPTEGIPSISTAATSTLIVSIVEDLVTIQTISTSSLLTSSATSIAAAAAAASTTALVATATSSSSPSNGEENSGECKLLGPFAVLVQAALGLLALSVLVFKRWRERPQRPIKIWAFDASKQVFGSALLHLANLFMSMFSAGQIEASIAKAAADAVAAGSGEPYSPNPCSFYLLNLAIDTTIGIPILIIILRVLAVGASYTPLARPPESIQSGNYGSPPKATWWLKQSMIYFIGLLGMKACVFVIFELCPWIVQVGDWALRWTEGNEAIQIAFVMLIFPLIMNALQYYIIDTFIKKRETANPVEEDNEPDFDEENDGLLAEGGEEQPEAGEDDETTKLAVKTAVKSKPKSKRIKSYDPSKDGEIGTPVEASSSSNASQMEEEPVKDKPVDF